MKYGCQPLNILLIDGNELDSNLIQRLLLRMSQGLWISTHVSSLEDGIQVYQAYQELHPDHQSFDLVILTLSLSGLHGLDVIRQFSMIYPKAKILVLTELSQKSLKIESLALGVLQFFIKDEVSIKQIKEVLQMLPLREYDASIVVPLLSLVPD
jgi:DNA-binding NarL/FixJ family response regulator